MDVIYRQPAGPVSFSETWFSETWFSGTGWR